jgi:hypothetical protein
MSGGPRPIGAGRRAAEPRKRQTAKQANDQTANLMTTQSFRRAAGGKRAPMTGYDGIPTHIRRP